MSKFKVGDREFECKQIDQRPYFISLCGEVISTVTGEPRILVGGNTGGYRALILSRGGERVLVRHHHLVMRYFVGIRPPGMVINHKDGNKVNNRLDNLEYCTQAENRAHAMVNRLYKSGSRCPWSKLDEDSVILLKSAHKLGMSFSQLARAFRISKRAAQKTVSGSNWKYAEEDVRKNSAEIL